MALLLVGGILLWIECAMAQQAPYPGQYNWPSPYNTYNPYGFRPLPESNARGTPPSATPPPATNGYTPAIPYPGLGYPSPWNRSTPRELQTFPPANVPNKAPAEPRLKLSVNATSVYVQQTFVLTLEVSYHEGLSAIDPVLPNGEYLAFRKIGNWEAEARISNQQQEVVNRLSYLVTPLRSADVFSESISVTGRTTAGNLFQTAAAEPLRLSIRSPEPGLIPWLPLEEYDIGTTLIGEKGVKEGKPITLVVEQRAIGATGTQLPSPEFQLRQGGFRLYLDASKKDGRLSRSGELVGTRIDTYTLQPEPDKMLMIPAVRFTWWNIREQRAETVLAPSRVLSSNAALVGDITDRLGTGLFPAGSSWVFWLPLTIIAFFTGLYWTLIWARGKRLRRRFKALLLGAAAPFRTKLNKQLALYSPRRHLHVARRRFAQSLPLTHRLWYCVRAAEEEEDPAVWSAALRFLVQRRLGTPSQVSMPELAETIIKIHPGTNPGRVRALLGELNAALYGQAKIGDFKQWKRDFKREIRPRLKFDPFRRLAHRSMAKLPGLNPR